MAMESETRHRLGGLDAANFFALADSDFQPSGHGMGTRLEYAEYESDRRRKK
jgi:hypothetical protein